MHKIVSVLAPKILPIDDAFDPASPSELAEAEMAMGVSLPELLREIQTVYGRFMFAGEAFIQVDGGASFGIFTVFGCKGKAGNMVIDFQDHADLQSKRLVPIADDMFNNRYVWNSTDDSVLFIGYADRKPPVVVAKTFEEFLDRIKVTLD